MATITLVALKTGVHLFAVCQPEILGGSLGDDRDDFLAAGELYHDLGVHRAVIDALYLTFKHVTRAEFHRAHPQLSVTIGLHN